MKTLYIVSYIALSLMTANTLKAAATAGSDSALSATAASADGLRVFAARPAAGSTGAVAGSVEYIPATAAGGAGAGAGAGLLDPSEKLAVAAVGGAGSLLCAATVEEAQHVQWEKRVRVAYNTYGSISVSSSITFSKDSKLRQRSSMCVIFEDPENLASAIAVITHDNAFKIYNMAKAMGVAGSFAYVTKLEGLRKHSEGDSDTLVVMEFVKFLSPSLPSVFAMSEAAKNIAKISSFDPYGAMNLADAGVYDMLHGTKHIKDSIKPNLSAPDFEEYALALALTRPGDMAGGRNIMVQLTKENQFKLIIIDLDIFFTPLGSLNFYPETLFWGPTQGRFSPPLREKILALDELAISLAFERYNFLDEEEIKARGGVLNPYERKHLAGRPQRSLMSSGFFRQFLQDIKGLVLIEAPLHDVYVVPMLSYPLLYEDDNAVARLSPFPDDGSYTLSLIAKSRSLILALASIVIGPPDSASIDSINFIPFTSVTEYQELMEHYMRCVFRYEEFNPHQKIRGPVVFEGWIRKYLETAPKPVSALALYKTFIKSPLWISMQAALPKDK